MADNVPKFASFRPKQKESKETPQPDDRYNKHEKSERRNKHEKDKPPSKHVPGPSSGTSRDVSRASREQSTSFFADRRGDSSIVKYGCLDRYKTPTYRRSGYGFILGLPTDYKIDREQSTDKGIILSGPRSRPRERLLTCKHVSKDTNRKLRFIKPAPVAAPSNDADFIELSSRRKRKRDADEGRDVDYRSVEGKKDTETPSDSDLESESDTELAQPHSEITQKNSTLIQRTRDNPQDVQAWLDLAEHQDAMMSIGRASTELSSVDRRNLADIRITTYEQAIRKIGNGPDSQVKLHLGLLTEAARSWNEEKLANKWEEVLDKYPSSPELWIKHLDFVQSAFVSFKYEKCKAAFKNCLKKLQASPTVVAPETLLHVLIRLTSMMRTAGYQELSLAIWQALLEFHLLRPEPQPKVPGQSEVGQDFEEFWEIEVGRIGEPDAKGWKNFDFGDIIPPITGTAQPLKLKQSTSVWEDFRIRELDHMEKMRHPGRLLDEDIEDDGFHVVLYSDFEEYLNVLPHDAPGTLILEAFLCFSGMPPFPELGSIRHAWWNDPFVQSQSVFPGTDNAGSKTFAQTLKEFMGGPKHFEVTLECLFDHGFPTVGPDRPMIAELNFIRHVLKLCATETAYAETIGEYLLAFEQNYFPSESGKTAKQLLKARPGSLRLYNAYGLVESRRDNHARAEQVYSIALSMQNTAALLTTPGSLQLFNGWVWEALQAGDKAGALWRLVSPHGKLPTSLDIQARPDQTSLLRARTLLTETNERALLSRDFPSAILSTSLLALLAYLTANEDPSAALSAFTNLSTWFQLHAMAASAADELHAQSIAQFLAYHATHAAIVKPALIRNTLEPLIARFPDNTVLLSLYAANEARFSIDDRVRGIVQHNALGVGVSNRSSLITWLFSNQYEMRRGEIAGSTSHSVRALFKKAEEDIGAHCPSLWKSHVRFEVSQYMEELKRRPPSKRPRRDGKESKRESRHETRLEECERRVKETFFRGVTQLPWCKEYMMMGFTELKALLTEEEMRRVYNVMLEKELRVRVDIDG